MSEKCGRNMFKDKTGCTFESSACRAEDARCVLEMYDLFVPKKASQGLPPENAQTRHEWVKNLLERGENFLVWQGGEVVGHAALVPDFISKDAEFLIFVRQPYRGRGLGSVLTKAAVDRAKDLGLELVWLTVESYNFWAIGLYKKYGFIFCEDQGWDRMMLLRF